MKIQEKIYVEIIFAFVFLTMQQRINAQPWIEDSHIFNPTGIPSLSFSQPRFYDLDNDGDLDMILGSTVQSPLYFKNIGSKTNPKFLMDATLLTNINSINAEMGVCVDIDSDGDLDFITGGYTGLNFYENIGSNMQPEFIESTNIFTQINVGENPVPTFADLDNDGDFDLAVGLSEDGGVKYYQNSGSTTAPEFLESNSVKWFDVGLYAYPYFTDLDKDGDVDLFVGRDGFGLKYYQNVGDAINYNWNDKSSLFQTVGNSTYWNSGALVDLSGDGKTDLVFGSASGQIFYYTNTGTNETPTWKENTTVFGGTIDIGSASSPFLFDYDADGDLDLFTGTQLGGIKYFENVGSQTNPAWKENSTFLSNVKHSIYSAVTVGDLNNDGKPDLIVGDFTGKLYLHLQTATGFPSVTTAMNIIVDGFAVPRLIDFDKDGDLDLIVGRDNGTISLFQNIGNSETAEWFEVPNYFSNIDVGMDAVPSIVDFDKDGDFDLIVGNISGEVKYFYKNGSQWIEDNSITANITVDQNAAPACADLDGDGDIDIVLGNYEGTFSYFINQNITAQRDETVFPKTFLLSQNYPNPFNPSTTVEFVLPEFSHVQALVFDMLGQEVFQVINEDLPAGKNNININFSSLNKSSGVYLFVINAKSLSGTNYRKSIKMNLVK